MVFLNLEVADHVKKQPKPTQAIPENVQIVRKWNIRNIPQSHRNMFNIHLRRVQMRAKLLLAQVHIVYGADYILFTVSLQVTFVIILLLFFCAEFKHVLVDFLLGYFVLVGGEVTVGRTTSILVGLGGLVLGQRERVGLDCVCGGGRAHLPTPTRSIITI